MIEQVLSEVTKPVEEAFVFLDGVRYYGIKYEHPCLKNFIGNTVRLRIDPADLKRVNVYNRDDHFICIAVAKKLQTVSDETLRDTIRQARERKWAVEKYIRDCENAERLSHQFHGTAAQELARIVMERDMAIDREDSVGPTPEAEITLRLLELEVLKARTILRVARNRARRKMRDVQSQIERALSPNRTEEEAHRPPSHTASPSADAAGETTQSPGHRSRPSGSSPAAPDPSQRTTHATPSPDQPSQVQDIPSDGTDPVHGHGTPGETDHRSWFLGGCPATASARVSFVPSPHSPAAASGPQATPVS